MKSVLQNQQARGELIIRNGRLQLVCALVLGLLISGAAYGQANPNPAPSFNSPTFDGATLKPWMFDETTIKPWKPEHLNPRSFPLGSFDPGAVKNGVTGCTGGPGSPEPNVLICYLSFSNLLGRAYQLGPQPMSANP